MINVAHNARRRNEEKTIGRRDDDGHGSGQQGTAGKNRQALASGIEKNLLAALLLPQFGEQSRSNDS